MGSSTSSRDWERPAVTRPAPRELRFTLFDDPELLGAMADVRRAGRGWVNIKPLVADEDLPKPPGPFAFLGGSVHKVPTVTWIPGKPLPDGSARATEVGLLHASGTRVARRLRDLGHPVPDGWRVTQDHPRRGLVLTVPPLVEDRELMTWLLQAAVAVCQVPTTGEWDAAVHTGVA
jgi:hypothetical protein